MPGTWRTWRRWKAIRGIEFVRADICDPGAVEGAMRGADAMVHFAAESHVDRSILSPEPVIETNLRGTFTLLEAARRLGVGRFLHVSTDEVYGSLEPPAEATEEFPAASEQPVFGVQGRLRPAGALLLHHL